MEKLAHLVGFGSQGAAWAECLRSAGWDVQVYLSREGKSWARATEAHFQPRLLKSLPVDLGTRSADGAPYLVAFMTPDSETGKIYNEYLARLTCPLTLVLAHGFAIYSGELKPSNPAHEPALFAPKAIGPKLLANCKEARASRGASGTHRLGAGFYASPRRQEQMRGLAAGLGFAAENLVEASFEQETIGDLISEQGLLCGGVFTLLEWTMKSMADAGVPAGLIQEECLTELELIAGMIREKGPSATFMAISQAAQAGTIAMRERLNRSDFRREFEEQVEQVVSKQFANYFREGLWKKPASELTANLAAWEQRFPRYQLKEGKNK